MLGFSSLFVGLISSKSNKAWDWILFTIVYVYIIIIYHVMRYYYKLSISLCHWNNSLGMIMTYILCSLLCYIIAAFILQFVWIKISFFFLLILIHVVGKTLILCLIGIDIWHDTDICIQLLPFSSIILMLVSCSCLCSCFLGIYHVYMHLAWPWKGQKTNSKRILFFM